MKKTFSSSQRLLLAVCIAVYTSAYICRLNLSAALGSISEAFVLTMPQAGMLQTLFAVIYAFGQLINGSIVDHVDPVRHMLTGLAGTAVCNLIMGLCTAYPALLAVWSVNAFFQSMMWTPIVRLIALHFDDDTLRIRAQGALAFTLVVGHFGAWLISGFLSAYVAWRYSFAAPAFIAAAVCLVSIRIFMRNSAIRKLPSRPSASVAASSAYPALHVFAASGFFLVLITCVLYGFIRDCVITWTPSILARLTPSGAVSSAFTLILPLINIAGVYLGFMLRIRGTNPYAVIVIMMVFAALCSALLIPAGGLLLLSILLGMICAAMYGANTMLTALIPMDYDRVGRTGMAAGMIDSCIYLGSALSGVIGGYVYEQIGPSSLYGAWILAAVVSGVLIHAGSRISMKFWKTFS